MDDAAQLWKQDGMAGTSGTSIGTEAFRLGRWRVEPLRNLVVGRDGSRTLERKSMALLVLLAERAPETVTRDEIIDAIWAGRVVTDDAINKQLSKLRAALATPAGSPPLIETVPKVGVRLTARAERISVARQKSQRTAVVLAAGALISAAAVGLWLSLSKSPEVSEEPLTTAPGAEFDPAISADGQWLAYASRTNAGGSVLFIRPMSGDRPQPVSPDGVAASEPAWSNDGKLAFVGLRPGDCAIFVRDRSGRIIEIAHCIAANVGGLTWLDSKTLAVSDRPGLGKSYELQQLNLSGGRRRLIAAPTGDLGDAHPLASRDGRSLYFLRSPTVGASELYRLTLATGTVQRLSAVGERVDELALGPGQSLIISAQRGEEGPSLWQFNVGSRRWARLTPGAAPDLAGSADGRTFAYTKVDRQTVLWRMLIEGTAPGSALTPSTKADWSPALSPDGRTLAFLSNRSGNEEIWLLNMNDGRTRRLTHYRGPNIQDLAWSSDSSLLLTSVPRGGQFDIDVVDAISGKTRGVALTELDERHGSFAPRRDAVFFVRRSGPKFELRRYDLASQKDAPVLDRVMRVVPSASSPRIVFTRPFLDGTWVLDASKARKISPFPDLSRMRDVTVVGDTAWTVDATGNEVRLVAVDVVSGRQRTFRSLPGIARPSGLAITGQSVIYARTLRLDADLVALRLKD